MVEGALWQLVQVGGVLARPESTTGPVIGSIDRSADSDTCFAAAEV